jgi:hypothetical protein
MYVNYGLLYYAIDWLAPQRSKIVTDTQLAYSGMYADIKMFNPKSFYIFLGWLRLTMATISCVQGAGCFGKKPGEVNEFPVVRLAE